MMISERGAVGTLALRHFGKVTASIRQVFVHDGARRCGVGSSLMRKAHAIAKESRCQTVALTLAEDNRALMPFYERLGYFPAIQYDDGELVLVHRLDGEDQA